MASLGIGGRCRPFPLSGAGALFPFGHARSVGSPWLRLCVITVTGDGPAQGVLEIAAGHEHAQVALVCSSRRDVSDVAHDAVDGPAAAAGDEKDERCPAGAGGGADGVPSRLAAANRTSLLPAGNAHAPCRHGRFDVGDEPHLVVEVDGDDDASGSTESVCYRHDVGVPLPFLCG